MFFCLRGLLCLLFGLEIAGECNIGELGGVQCCGLCRDGLPLGALRLIRGSQSLNSCSLTTHREKKQNKKKHCSSVRHLNPFLNSWTPINPSLLCFSAGIPPSFNVQWFSTSLCISSGLWVLQVFRIIEQHIITEIWASKKLFHDRQPHTAVWNCFVFSKMCS